jgi:hypothetical protein
MNFITLNTDFFFTEVFTAVTISGVVLLAAMPCSPTQKTVFLVDMLIFSWSLYELGDSNSLKIYVTNKIVNVCPKLSGKDLDPSRLSPTALRLGSGFESTRVLDIYRRFYLSLLFLVATGLEMSR